VPWEKKNARLSPGVLHMSRDGFSGGETASGIPTAEVPQTSLLRDIGFEP
jgi:hypothetical protein